MCYYNIAYACMHGIAIGRHDITTDYLANTDIYNYRDSLIAKHLEGVES